MPPLDEDNIRAIKVSGKTKRFYDGQGLYLELSKAGGKHWRWKYRFDYKEKRLSFGAWPETKLQDARDMRDKARAILLSGIIPAAKMKLTKEMKLRKDPHIVPLATQAMDLLSKVQHFTGRGRYIFPNPRDKNLPMSENAVNVASGAWGTIRNR